MGGQGSQSNERLTGDRSLEASVATLIELEARRDLSDAEGYHRAIAAIHGLSSSILAAERDGQPSETIWRLVAPARAVQASSPFVRRLQEWPRGYPGDFETIEYLCDGRNQARAGTLGYQIERYCLNSAIAQQHRNKVRWQSEKILASTLALGNPRILSIGCGGSRDLMAIEGLLAKRRPEIVLSDLDVEALGLSISRLRLPEGCIRAVSGSVIRSSRTIQALAPFDLIVAGGIFDYLSGKHARWLGRKAIEWLAPDGVFCFTNIAAGNPDRCWMEYIADWQLIERSDPEMHDLVSAAESTSDITIQRDTTGLTHLVEIHGGVN